MTRFLLIRHATTDAVGKRLSGRVAGVSLSDEGRQQAQRLTERLAELPISAVYCSPLERALETAEPIARSHDLVAVINENFIEIDFGKWTNCTFKEIEDDPEFKLFNSSRSITRIPEGEIMAEAQLRITTGLEKLCNQHQNETVAVISHSDLIKSVIAFYAGIHLDLFQRIEISPASVSVIEIYKDTARILSVNNIGDLKF